MVNKRRLALAGIWGATVLYSVGVTSYAITKPDWVLRIEKEEKIRLLTKFAEEHTPWKTQKDRPPFPSWRLAVTKDRCLDNKAGSWMLPIKTFENDIGESAHDRLNHYLEHPVSHCLYIFNDTLIGHLNDVYFNRYLRDNKEKDYRDEVLRQMKIFQSILEKADNL